MKWAPGLLARSGMNPCSCCGPVCHGDIEYSKRVENCDTYQPFAKEPQL